MEFIANNWYILVAAAAAVAVIIYLIMKFFKLPRESQIKKIKEWLLFAVTEADIVVPFNEAFTLPVGGVESMLLVILYSCSKAV